MHQAWQRGISPYEFRKCLKSDMKIIESFEDAKLEIQKDKTREIEIKNKMHKMEAQRFGNK